MSPAHESVLLELANRYADLVDARSFDDLDQVFTADAVLETGRGRRDGLDEIQAAMASLHRYERTEHRVLGGVATVDGDRATGTVTCHAHHFFVEDGRGRDHQMEITYHDEYVATVDGWRMTHRRLEIHRAETIDAT